MRTAPCQSKPLACTGVWGVCRNPTRESGSIIVTTALLMLFLLGMSAIAVDFGHMFVVKTELQSAADSCALAAAKELDGGPDAITRATSVGETIGNLNKVNFQGGAAGIVDADITFSSALNGAYSRVEPVATAKYVKCSPKKTGMTPWLFQALAAFTSDPTYKAAQRVDALGVATRASSQSACHALPVQIKPKVAGAGAPNYGYAVGEWIPSVYDESKNNSAPTNGQFGWGNLDGSTNAAETKAELLGEGPCNLTIGDPVGTPGAKVAAGTEWNSRFGLYKNGANPQITDPPGSANYAPPDTTGYSYTAKNWLPKANAFSNFLIKRSTFRSYGDTTDTVTAGNVITGLTLPNAYQDANMGTYSVNPNRLSLYGRNRRLMIAPFVTGTTIADWACVLMLHPIDGPKVTVNLEYLGNAGSSTSPCASAGLPGGAGGPLVPVLVQ